MHRIDGAGHVGGMFVAEDPSINRPPTEVTPEWLNAVQEELASLVEWAGAALDKGDNTQLIEVLLVKVAMLETAQTFTAGQRGGVVELPATSGDVTINLDLANNWTGVLTGNITLTNPINITPGQSGVIRIVNDVDTPRAIAYGSYWKAAGGVLPSLTAADSAVDLLGYYVESATRIWIGVQGDVK